MATNLTGQQQIDRISLQGWFFVLVTKKVGIILFLITLLHYVLPSIEDHPSRKGDFRAQDSLQNETILHQDDDEIAAIRFMEHIGFTGADLNLSDLGAVEVIRDHDDDGVVDLNHLDLDNEAEEDPA
eukprot:CAMPEP_0116568320 /NCGR_PEP_ID=MMETSP0397-20121206/15576_1 /TAXON_ID=216820 /ORGANISM="Cyclophora tenuis, Strain ECT3854" /LENGTH=126 /DNA_ID=CAMNT_0004095567 /DNA_START=44 /DNA_END=420 /DNA_ORIENTATION=+